MCKRNPHAKFIPADSFFVIFHSINISLDGIKCSPNDFLHFCCISTFDGD